MGETSETSSANRRTGRGQGPSCSNGPNDSARRLGWRGLDRARSDGGFPPVELAVQAIGDALEQVVGRANRGNVEDRVVAIADERPLVGVGREGVADLAGVAGRPTVARAALGGVLGREVQEVDRVARLAEIGALLHQRAEELDVLVFRAGLGRASLEVARLVVLLLAPEKEHLGLAVSAASRPWDGAPGRTRTA